MSDTSDEIRPPQTLTIDEVAERLGTNRNRIVRLLRQPELAPLVQTEERVTRTGTRTARVVPVLVLDRIALALKAKPDWERVQKRVQEHRQERVQTEKMYAFSGIESNAGSADNGHSANSVVIEELRARLADKDRMLAAQASEIVFLRAALEREQESRLNGQRLQLSEQQIIVRKIIESMPVPADPETPEAILKKNGGSSGAAEVRARMKLKVIEPCQIPQVRT